MGSHEVVRPLYCDRIGRWRGPLERRCDTARKAGEQQRRQPVPEQRPVGVGHAAGRLGIDDLERYAKQPELVIVAAGKGDIAKLFERDPEKSPFDTPQRALALTYVNGMLPRPD